MQESDKSVVVGTSVDVDVSSVQQSSSSASPKSLVEEIAETTERLDLSSGRQIVAEQRPDGDHLTIKNPDGEVELLVTLTADGPVLRFKSAQLALESQGAVDVKCEHFRVVSKKGIEHRTGGDLTEVVHGNRVSKVRKTSSSVAAETRIESTRGNVDVLANDDARILAERIKLNC